MATQHGLASYYGPGFEDKLTASGVPFSKHSMVAAHPLLPLGSKVRVTNLQNGKAVDVKIIDRGPVQKYRIQGVVIDLSEKAAAWLHMRKQGRVPVKVEMVDSTLTADD